MPELEEKTYNTWKELAALVNSLPDEDRLRYQQAINRTIHDLRSVIGIIFSAESLLRRKREGCDEDTELLDIIEDSSKQAISMLTEVAKPFDNQVTVPLSRPASRRRKQTPA